RVVRHEAAEKADTVDGEAAPDHLRALTHHRPGGHGPKESIGCHADDLLEPARGTGRAMKDGSIHHLLAQPRIADAVIAGAVYIAVDVDRAGLGDREIAHVLARDRAAPPGSERRQGDAVLRRPAAIGGMVDEAALAADD